MSTETKTYKLLELVGASSKSIEDAINTALARSSETVRNMEWFEVKEFRGSITDGKASQFQVTLKVGFRLE
jgi:flavin-binding protein dodecin